MNKRYYAGQREIFKGESDSFGLVGYLMYPKVITVYLMYPKVPPKKEV
jgi:hypothetical protein